MDSGLFTGHQRMGAAWQAFRDFVESTPDLPSAPYRRKQAKAAAKR